MRPPHEAFHVGTNHPPGEFLIDPIKRQPVTQIQQQLQKVGVVAFTLLRVRLYCLLLEVSIDGLAFLIWRSRLRERKI